MNDDLAEVAIRSPEKEWPILVLAHPCSGTQFACHSMRRGMLGVQHEQINPSQVNPAYPGSVVVSYQYWDVQSYKHVWHLVRDPLKTVFSAAALCEKEPKYERKFLAHSIDNPVTQEKILARMNPLYTMMWSVAFFHMKAERFVSGAYRFRVEDITIHDDLPHGHQNSHVKMEPGWDLLEILCRDEDDSMALGVLRRCHKAYGYTD